MYVSLKIIPDLLNVQANFRELGYEIEIKDGYRSKELYQLASKKRVETIGNDDGLNMITMPHSTGTTIDIALWDTKANSRVQLYDGIVGYDGWFLDYYNDVTDPDGSYRNIHTIMEKVIS